MVTNDGPLFRNSEREDATAEVDWRLDQLAEPEPTVSSPALLAEANAGITPLTEVAANAGVPQDDSRQYEQLADQLGTGLAAAGQWAELMGHDPLTPMEQLVDGVVPGTPITWLRYEQIRSAR